MESLSRDDKRGAASNINEHLYDSFGNGTIPFSTHLADNGIPMILWIL